jgi:hypothetical protein
MRNAQNKIQRVCIEPQIYNKLQGVLGTTIDNTYALVWCSIKETLAIDIEYANSGNKNQNA